MHDKYNLNEDLNTFFPQLRYQLTELQEKSIRNVLDNDSTLCIIQTGGGKSLIYWMAAAKLGGITLVISPLTALISEQADKIREHGFTVLELHGDIPANKQMKSLKDLAKGNITPNFIFASPEKIATDGLFEYCLKCRKNDLKLVVIDEVHCVSQWGMSFRPFYKRIPNFMDNLFGNAWCRILALTATVNPKELIDICDSFHIKRNNIIRQELLMRSEIQLHVLQFINENEKEEKFWEIVEMHRDEKILVYVYRKLNDRGVEGLCKKAIEKGYKAVYFHGDMSRSERMEVINKYRAGEINLVFATNAFGMGIDIKDIRVVIHFMIPESAEQYYQEIGRAARDGYGANAYLLYSNKNIDVKRTHFINRSFPNEEKLKSVYKKLVDKVGYGTIPYFDDEEIQNCLPYYLESGLVEIVGKGFPDLKNLSNIEDPIVKDYYDSTKMKGFVRTLKKCNITPEQLSFSVYSALVNDTISVSNPLGRWLVLNVHQKEIDENSLKIMLDSIEEKKKYKNELLDYFVYIIKNNYGSKQLHQELAIYLGVDKHQAPRIYDTDDGNHVRSKSEVIISNALFSSGIKYSYEEKLFYEENKWIEPDFTISLSSGKKLFWEHIGLLGSEDYDNRWRAKLNIYLDKFPNQLIKTYESGNISKDAQAIIKRIKEMK